MWCKLSSKSSLHDWLVNIVRCSDNILYTGIAKHVVRRCKQHNAGTASKYTRSRRPVKLVYQEIRNSHGSALQREITIKAMTRQEKPAMIRQRKNPG